MVQQHWLVAVKNAIWSRRARWGLSLVASQLAPLLEVCFILLLYVVVDAEKRADIFRAIDHLRWPGGNVSLWPEWQVALALSGAALLALALSAGIRYLSEMNMVKLTYDFYVRDSQDLVGRYLCASVPAARRVRREKVTSSILIDCGTRANMAKQFIFIATAVFAMLIYVVGSCLISWQLLAVGAIVYLLPIYLSRRLYDKMQLVGRMKIGAQEKVIGHFTDVLSGFERAKLDGMESYLSERSGHVLRKGQKWRVTKGRTRAKLRIVAECLPLVGLLAMLFLGTTLAMATPASLLLFLVIFTRVKSYVDVILSAYMRIRESIPHIRRHMALLSELGTQDKRVVDLSTPEKIREIAARGVSFGYTDEAVIEHVNFSARSGDRVLIQGPSGDGKSTLLQVLCGLLPPSAGEVTMNGKVLDSDTFHRLRSSIGYSSPNMYLFRGTLRTNLLMGTDQRDETLTDAVHLAELQGVVKELPEGLDTGLGNDGDVLSLGQRQRVLLARLFMRRPSVVLLDEATANLDPEMETRIMRNLLCFIGEEAILIMVAHKAPAGIEFNRRYIMENGRLSACNVEDAAS